MMWLEGWCGVLSTLHRLPISPAALPRLRTLACIHTLPKHKSRESFSLTRNENTSSPTLEAANSTLVTPAKMLPLNNSTYTPSSSPVITSVRQPSSYDATSDQHNLIVGALSLLLAFCSIVVAIVIARSAFRTSVRNHSLHHNAEGEVHALQDLEGANIGNYSSQKRQVTCLSTDDDT